MKKFVCVLLLFSFKNLSGQNVGIGTSSPTRPLSFPGLLGKKISLYPGASGDAGFGVFNNELRIHSDYSGADITLGYDDFTLGFTERMRIKGNGNIGIGTNNPFTTLHVKSSNINPVIFDGASPMWLTLAEDGINRGYIGSYAGNNEDVELGTYGGNITGAVHLTTNNTPRLTVINNGNTGIGLTNPSEKLQVAGNVKADNFNYATPKTFYYSISPAAFKPQNSTHNITSWDREAYYNTTNVPGFLTAPVYLPDGAVVTSATMYYYDNSSAADIFFYLCATPHGSNVFNTITSLTTSGTPGNSSLFTNSILNAVVNNQNNSYAIRIQSLTSPFAADWPGSNLIIKAVVISYTMASAQ
jgi:hypothetical protein